MRIMVAASRRTRATTSEAAPTRFSMEFHRRRLLHSAAARSATPGRNRATRGPLRLPGARAGGAGLNLVVSDTGDRNDSPFDAANVVEISLRRSATRAKLSTVTRLFVSSPTPARPSPGAVALSASRCFSAASFRRASSSSRTRHRGERGETATRGAARSSRSSKLLNTLRPIVGALRRVRASCERGDLRKRFDARMLFHLAIRGRSATIASRETSSGATTVEQGRLSACRAWI